MSYSLNILSFIYQTVIEQLTGHWGYSCDEDSNCPCIVIKETDIKLLHIPLVISEKW